MPLSTVSLRPTLLLDGQFGRRVIDADKPFPEGRPGSVGMPAPFGRGRIVSALPTNATGPVQVSPPIVFADVTSYLGDPSGNLVGEANALFVHRLVYANPVEDTRRLGGVIS